MKTSCRLGACIYPVHKLRAIFNREKFKYRAEARAGQEGETKAKKLSPFRLLPRRQKSTAKSVAGLQLIFGKKLRLQLRQERIPSEECLGGVSDLVMGGLYWERQ